MAGIGSGLYSEAFAAALVEQDLEVIHSLVELLLKALQSGQK